LIPTLCANPVESRACDPLKEFSFEPSVPYPYSASLRNYFSSGNAAVEAGRWKRIENPIASSSPASTGRRAVVPPAALLHFQKTPQPSRRPVPGVGEPLTFSGSGFLTGRSEWSGCASSQRPSCSRVKSLIGTDTGNAIFLHLSNSKCKAVPLARQVSLCEKNYSIDMYLLNIN
jgi:hypothetical protein